MITDNDFFPKKKPKRNYGCEAMVVFFILFFIASAFLIWKIYYGINNWRQNSQKPQVEYSTSDLNSLNDKVKNFSEAQNTTIKMDITEQELSAYFEVFLSESNLNLGLKKTYVVIDPKGITFAGQGFLNKKIEIIVLPQIINNHLVLSLVKSDLPQAVTKPFLDKIAGQLENQLTQDKLTLKDVELQDGKMTISAGKKENGTD